jgi:hypothetical protein
VAEGVDMKRILPWLTLAEAVGFEPARPCGLPDFERPKGKKRRGFCRSFKAFEYCQKSLYHAGLQAIKAEAARYTGNIRKEALLPRIRVETIEN